MNNLPLRIKIALCILVASTTAVLLCLLNYGIFKCYTPDMHTALKALLPQVIVNPDLFQPEPVERLQYLVTLCCLPVFSFLVFSLLKKMALPWLKNGNAALIVNCIAIACIAGFLFFVLKAPMAHIAGENNSYFFRNNLIHKFQIVFPIAFYAAAFAGYLKYNEPIEHEFSKPFFKILSCFFVAVLLVVIVFYNVFHLAAQRETVLMETNAVFYSVTQVFAGKSLMVDISSQYGLYPWFLNPIFKITGLSIFSFSLVMGCLNALSFLFFYLGIKKVMKKDFLALLVFLCLLFWLYWQVRLPLRFTPRFFYQYWPIRILFPSIVFYLCTVFFSAARRQQKVILPLLAIVSSAGVLWNLDTGIVAFGATFIALLFFSYQPGDFRGNWKRWLTIKLTMVSALALIVSVFALATKVHSGCWPAFGKALHFQSVFYVSGYYMLPMGLFGFWNVLALFYLFTAIYCVWHFRAKDRSEPSIIVFLFVLGAGIFAYFQGRSYYMTLVVVLYPAIILSGIFCRQLIATWNMDRKAFPTEVLLIAFFLFLFVADGALSMVLSSASTSIYSYKNAFGHNPSNEKKLAGKMDFIRATIPEHDTIIIIAQDYESYYYSQGAYYNPLHLPGSTEVFFKSELYTLLGVLKDSRYPVLYDIAHPWKDKDTIEKTLATYYKETQRSSDSSIILYRK